MNAANGGRRPCSFAAAAIIASCFLIPAVGGDAVESLEGSIFYLASRPGGLVLDVSGGGMKDGTQFILWEFHGQENQQLMALPSGEAGLYFIQSQKSKKYMDAGADDSLVIQSKSGADSQKWRITSVADGWYAVESKSTGKAVSVRSGAKGGRGAVVLAEKSDSPSQLWKIWMKGETPEDFRNKAMASYNSGARKDTLDSIRRSIGLAPMAARYYHDYWWYAAQLGEDRAILDSIDDYLKQGIPEGHESLQYRARALRKLDRGAEAAVWCRKDISFLENLLAGARVNDDAKSAAYCRNEIIEDYGLLAWIEHDGMNYEKALAYLEAARRLDPDTANYTIADACSSAAWRLGMTALGRGECRSAIEFFNRADAIRMKNAALAGRKNWGDLALYLDIARRRLALPAVAPEYTEKILVLYLRHFTGTYKNDKGETVSFNQSVTPRNERDGAVYQGVLARFVEVYSSGKLSLEFRRAGVDSVLTGYYRWGDKGENCEPDMNYVVPEISDIMYRNIGECDAVLIYWDPSPLHTPNWGGSTTAYPILAYQWYIPRRGFMEVHRDAGVELLFHEYFHTVEQAWGFKSQDRMENKEEYFPGCRDKRQFDYWEFMFQNIIPKKMEENSAKGERTGWLHFSYSKRDPLRLTEALYAFNKNAVWNVPLDKRKEAWDLKKKAEEAWKKGDRELSDSLYREAFEINPAFFDYYRHFGDRAAERKDYDEALKMYRDYVRFTGSVSHFHEMGKISLVMEKFEDAADNFRSSVDYSLSPGEKLKYCSLACRRLADRKRFDDVIGLCDRVAGLKGKAADECLFWKGEALCGLGKTDEGMAVMMKALRNGLGTGKDTAELDEGNWWVKRYRSAAGRK